MLLAIFRLRSVCWAPFWSVPAYSPRCMPLPPIRDAASSSCCSRVVIGGSLLLLLWRASQIRSSVKFSLIARDRTADEQCFPGGCLCQRAAGYALSIGAGCAGAGKISVGPYFNSVFIPLTIPLGSNIDRYWSAGTLEAGLR